MYSNHTHHNSDKTTSSYHVFKSYTQKLRQNNVNLPCIQTIHTTTQTKQRQCTMYSNHTHHNSDKTTSIYHVFKPYTPQLRQNNVNLPCVQIIHTTTQTNQRQSTMYSNIHTTTQTKQRQSTIYSNHTHHNSDKTTSIYHVFKPYTPQLRQNNVNIPCVQTIHTTTQTKQRQYTMC